MSWYENRSDLPWFLQNLDMKLPYVECGVWMGEHLDHVRHVWGGECIGIDAYKQFAPSEYADGSNISQSQFDAIHRSVSERHKIIRSDTVAAASQFEDGSVGCVYLDSNHSYIHLMREMEAWWPKIAEGGVMAGHDFRAGLSEDKRTRFAVCRCVYDFTVKHKLALLRTSDGQDWYVLKQPYYQSDEIVIVSNFHGQWPECVRENHQAYCDRFGYTYAPYSELPPGDREGQWSKITAIQRTWREYPEKKFIFWVDADIVFMSPIPMHQWAFTGFDLIGGAYKIPGFETGALNSAWFGFPNVEHMRSVIDRSLDDAEFSRRYPHEEAALSKILSPRANQNVLLEDIHHVAPCTYWNGYYSSHAWMLHVIGLHGAIRKTILEDCCAMSRVSSEA